MNRIEGDLLLVLLRSALGNRVDSNDFSNVDWNVLIRLAESQGVISSALDGFQKIQITDSLDIDTYLKWLGKATTNSDYYDSYVQTIADLAAFFAKYGLKMMVMKGLSCSLNYSVPSHRPCGDIDIWLFGDYEKANSLIQEQLGIPVSCSNPHHAVFVFEGRTIENHATILDVNVHKSNQYLNGLLEELAEDAAPQIIIGHSVYFPSSQFNSIHLLRHMASDFATTNTSLKQILDWATFVNNNEVDWNFVRGIAQNSRMNVFLDALNQICVDSLGFEPEQFPVGTINNELEQRVLREILEDRDYNNKKSGRVRSWAMYGIHKTALLWQNRWKHKMVYDESMFDTFWWKTKHNLRNL